MTAGEDRIQAAAEEIAATRLGHGRLSRLPTGIRPRDSSEAYAVQAALHRRLEGAGRGTVVGHKIGCTTEVMQRYLRIDSPCAGGVFSRTVHQREARLESGDFRRIGVECEIAVRLGADLPDLLRGHDRGTVARAVDRVMAAIEIVEDRYVDFRAFDTPTLIADDFFNAGCVLGEPVEAWNELDLAGLEGRMRIDGKEVGRGHGRDILGHPFEALAWLANSLNVRGDRLRAGEFVLLGSLVQTVWLQPGNRVHIEVDRLGAATLSLS